MIWLKRIGLLALALLIAAGFYLALREKPASVDVAMVIEGPMQVTIREQGTARVRNIYTVSSPISGHLSRTMLAEGDKVEAGRTVVASIHPLDPPLIDARTMAELQSARDAARSGVGLAMIELQRAETALKLADDDLRRATKLFTPGVISESALQKFTTQVDIQKNAVDAAKAAIAVREAELASAEARLLQTDPSSAASNGGCCVNLVAPVSGTVLSIAAKSEQAVSAGMRIAEIGDVSDLEIAVELLSSDAVRIKPGARAQIVDWGGGALDAAVRRVDPSAFTKVSALGIEEQRVNAILDLDVKDARLGHNYRVFAQMAIWECKACVQVPIAALFRTGNEWAAFVVDGGRVVQKPVSVGHMNADMAEVTGGLLPGMAVVVHPNDVLSDGSLVEPRS